MHLRHATFAVCALLLLPPRGECQAPRLSVSEAAARINAVLWTSFDGGSVPVVQPEFRAVPAPVPASRPAQAMLVPPSLWDAAKPPQPADLDLLASRLPGLDPAAVRELSFEEVDPVLMLAVRRGASALDIFTDEGLRGKQVYYLSEQTLDLIYAKYELNSVTPGSGNDIEGRPFHLQALVMGAGRLDLLYDRDKFTYASPEFKNYDYICQSRVTERVRSSGDMSVEGLQVDTIFHPKIQRFLKLAPTQVRIEVYLGKHLGKTNRDWELRPILLRDP